MENSMGNQTDAQNFFSRYGNELYYLYNSEPIEKTAELAQRMLDCGSSGGRVIVIGNGGSASIASHVCIDLMKAANITATCFSDPSMMTCLSNDFGYENAYKKALEYNFYVGDLVILISSSGESKNIINTAQFCIEKGLTLVTFSGFAEANSLRTLGCLNFYVNSDRYNYIETTHSTWLLAAVDFCIVQKQKYGR